MGARSASREFSRIPAAGRQASLLGGAVILVARLATLALVRPWSMRLPGWLVIVPALAGAVIAITHALVAYVTRTLHLLGVIELDFAGWAEHDDDASIRCDLLFYEP